MENQEQFVSSQSSTQPMVLPGVGDLLKRTWQVYTSRLKVFLGIMLLPFLLGIVIVAVSAGAIILGGDGLGILLLVLFLPVVYLATIIVGLWSSVSLLFAIKEREAKIGIKESLKKGWHKIISYWWISVLSAVIIMGGFFLFVAPGIIFSVWFALAIYVLVSEDIKGMNALFRSKQLVAGKWWSVLWRFIVMAAVVIILSLALRAPLAIFLPKPVGEIFGLLVSFLLGPFPVVYSFLIYEDLKKHKANPVFEPPSKGTKIKYILVGVIGLLLIPVILLIVFGSIVSSSFKGAQEAARDARRTVDISQIETALILYRDTNNVYPAALNELAGQSLLGEIPKAPKPGLPYEYKIQAGGQNYELCVDFEKKEDECFRSENPDSGFQPPAETTDWQTYRSEEFGFEMKYPKNGRKKK